MSTAQRVPLLGVALVAAVLVACGPSLDRPAPQEPRPDPPRRELSGRQLVPKVVPNLVAASIALGAFHACAVTASGRVSCWGENRYGQLGLAGSTGSRLAVPAGGEVDFASIAVGERSTCGLSLSGHVYCCGWGIGPNPRPVSDTVFSSVSVGAEHSCALTAAGDTFCWGSNRSEQLGIVGIDSAGAPMRLPWTAPFAYISLGSYHACALDLPGTVWCWGRGSGTTGRSDSVYTHLSAGAGHTCAIARSRRTYCWGSNASGQLGSPYLAPWSGLTPIPVHSGEPFVSVSSGDAHTCALTADGRAFCWGSNEYGQLGIESDFSCDELLHKYGRILFRCSQVPVEVHTPQRFVEIRAGGRHTCARRADGQVFCWGQDGLLGS